MGVTAFVSRVANYFSFKEPLAAMEFSDEELLEDAHEKLIQARNVFATTEPDFIDYAVYNLQAAEERYNSLFKRIKRSHYNA